MTSKQQAEKRPSLYEFKEKNGRSYYYDPVTNTASWDVPPEVDAGKEEHEQNLSVGKNTGSQKDNGKHSGGYGLINVNDLDIGPFRAYWERCQRQLRAIQEIMSQKQYQRILVKAAFVFLLWWASTTTATISSVPQEPKQKSLEILRRVEASIADKFGVDALPSKMIANTSSSSSIFRDEDENMLQRIQESMLQVEQGSCPEPTTRERKNPPMSFLNHIPGRFGRRDPGHVKK